MNDVIGTTQSRVPVMPGTSYVEWGAILAGGVMAAGLSFILLSFGAGVGLSLTSPWSTSGASSKTVTSLAVFWTLAQQIGSFLIGGYIAGRMRARWAEANPDEVEFRDGLHGGLVWAVGVVIGATLLLSTAGSIARTGTEVVGKAVSAAAANSDPLQYQIDTLLRPGLRVVTPGSPAPVPTAAPLSPATPATADLRSELLRLWAKGVAAGSLAANDRIYLASVVAQRTGLTQQDAERRVDDAFAEASRLAKEATEKARRAAVLAGLVTAASLLLSLAGAWWAGICGGHHRDNAIPARFVFTKP